MSVARWADENLAIYGDYDALVVEGRTFTNQALHDQSCRLASAFVELGVAPADRIALVLPSGFELFVAFTAALRAGAVPVVLHHDSPVADLERLVAHCGARGLVAGARQIPALGQAASTLPHRVAVGAGTEIAAGWHRFQHLIERHPPLEQPVVRADDDPAQIVYTSGTTGTPKGIVYTHGNIAGRFPSPGAMTPAGAAASKPIVRLMALPPAHALGGSFFFLRLVSRSKIVCLDKFDPERCLTSIQEHRVSTAILVPAMCEALLKVPDVDRHDLSSLRQLVVGGAAVSTSLIERFQERFTVRLSVIYGLTEVPGATLGATSSKPGSVGKLAPGVEARIVDAEGNDLPPGEIGEIHLKTPWATDSTDVHSPGVPVKAEWFATGDIGYLGAHRELFVIGRSKEMISQGGVKVFPQEIIDVILRLGVRDCAVLGLPNPRLGEEAIACVVLAPGTTHSADAILAHCRLHLDRRKVPASVHFFDALPKTDLGKVQVHVLRELVEARRTSVVDTDLARRLRSAPPRQRRSLLEHEIETSLRRILAADAPAPEIPTTAGFGELGLDSIGAVELANALSAALGRRVSETVTFDHPTIAGVCEHLLHAHFESPAAEIATVSVRRRHHQEPVAIVGIGCRLPGVDATIAEPETFWDLLRDGVDTTRIVPPERWNVDDFYDPKRGTPGKTYTREGAFIDSPDLFDAEFFGIGPLEAKELDPQQRLLLEVSWEAISHAGYAPQTLSQGSTGVFVGITGSSYVSGNFLGLLPCVAAGRLSHFFNLRGPCLAIDTACSSSLVALHTAVQSLRMGECDAALAGGVHVMASPRSFVGLAAIQALAADGRCKAFDARADGYGRGEGCVMFVLKPLSVAEADRDRIIALIRGSAINHDGRSSSLTAPNGQAQKALLWSALEDAALEPNQVDYLEAHGTGTPLGDPIELQAVAAVLGANRDQPLVVGSVKTNIGHLEAAAGAAGLLKVALSLSRAEIPPHLHFTKLNPILEPVADRIAISTELRAWPTATGRRRIGGVTSLGMSGTNAHIVLEEAPHVTESKEPDEIAGQPPVCQLLCLSARTETALDELAARFGEHLHRGTLDAFSDQCFTANAGRAHFSQRLFVTASTAAVASEKLMSSAQPPGSKRGQAPSKRPKIAFLFTGQGSPYLGMARRLYETQRTFRQALDSCAEILHPLLPRPLLEALFVDPDRPGTSLGLEDAVLAQPAIFAIEWSLVELWRSYGVEPELVLGHSLGEYVAACVAGLFSQETGLKLVAERGRLTQTLPATGTMLAVAASEERAREVIAPYSDRVSVGAINGRDAIVVSGHRDAIAEISRTLTAEGVKNRPLQVGYAYHSPLVEPIMAAWERVVSELTYLPPRVPLVSTLTGRLATAEELADAAYWRRHLRDPVQFAAGIDAMLVEGCDAFVEVGPSPILLGMARQHLGTSGEAKAWLPSLRRDREDLEQILDSLGELYLRGLEPDWNGLYRDNRPRRVTLPGYPFERKSYWSTALASPAARADRGRGEPPPAARRRAVASAPVLSGSTAERIDQVVAASRTILGAVIGGAPESIALDRNLLDEGLDSLRVTDFLSGLRRALGVESSPAEFLSRPTIGAFAEYLVAQHSDTGTATTVASPGSPTVESVAPTVPLAPTLKTSSPLIVINDRGRRTPLFCFHAAGGQATPYLRFRALLGDEQPLYAIQSRGSSAPEREHKTLEMMAVDYATLIQDARPGGPFRLLGWSMGGFIGHAVAHELERRGERVDFIGMVDARPEGRIGMADSALAVLGVMHDLQVSSPEPRLLYTELGALDATPVAPDSLLEWCEQRGLIPRGAIAADVFDRMVRLYASHFELLRGYQPEVVRAPIANWWAGTSAPRSYWANYTAATAVDRVVGGTHFSVIRPPFSDTIAAELVEQLDAIP